MMKYLNLFIVAIVFILASTTATFAQTETVKTEVADTAKTIQTKVKGITCSTDLKMISANVEKLDGVSTCKAVKNGPTTTFEIVYDPALIEEKDIYAAIQNTGSCENPNERPYTVKQ